MIELPNANGWWAWLRAFLELVLHGTIQPGVIHQSVCGIQYAADDYLAGLYDHKIQISMSRTGNPYDNGKAERFKRALKYEEIYLDDYETIAEVRLSRAFHRSGLQS